MPVYQHSQQQPHQQPQQHSGTDALQLCGSDAGRDEARAYAQAGLVATMPQAPVVGKAGLIPEAEPDMHGPQGMTSMAVLLEAFAVEFDGNQQLQKGLSIRVLALQLLLLACQDQNAPADTAVTVSEPSHLNSAQQHEAKLARDATEQLRTQEVADNNSPQGPASPEARLTRKQIRQMVLEIASKADEAVKVLREDGEGTTVPYVWQVVYEAALNLARSGSTQEVIGDLQSCIQPYSQVCFLTHWPPHVVRVLNVGDVNACYSAMLVSKLP